MKHASLILAGLASLLLAACGGSDKEGAQGASRQDTTPAQVSSESGGEEDHAHAEDPLGTVKIGDLDVELAQGHGGIVAGKEGHLVVKLPYSDKGSTVVRAWIGTKDRTLSFVGKGEYAPSHDDYDVHASAPDPLPENPMWWIEVEKPDGTKLVGSARPLFE